MIKFIERLQKEVQGTMKARKRSPPFVDGSQVQVGIDGTCALGTMPSYVYGISPLISSSMSLHTFLHDVEL